MKNCNLYHKIQTWRKSTSSLKFRKCLTITFSCLLALAILLSVAVLSISLSIKNTTSESIISPEEACNIEDIDYIIILGAGLRNDGSPSDMLTDRLLTGIDILDRGSDAPLLLSGDNSGERYNEVGAMYSFVIENNVDGDNIVLDNEGFSTYESIYRAKNDFSAQKVIIITQEYHLHRALYIARELGIEAYGVSADIRTYRGQEWRDLREHLARTKDFFKCLLESKK